MGLNLERTLERVKDRQWALADIDWDAPGAEQITDEQRPALTAFMADLVWIEHVGARGFAALAKQAEDPTLVSLYRYFHAEEQRHANAEMALMHRWGMLDDGKVPPPNINIRLVMAWLDGNGDDLPLSFLSAGIPLLEVALDGALLKFLLDQVDDPICHAVFDKVNNDESRHLAVGFEVMDRLGSLPMYKHLLSLGRAALNPTAPLGLVTGIPLLTNMLSNLEAMGLDSERLVDAATRYEALGNRTEGTPHNPVFQVFKHTGSVLKNRSHPMHRVGSALATLTEHYPSWLEPHAPSWAGDVTYEPVA